MVIDYFGLGVCLLIKNYKRVLIFDTGIFLTGLTGYTGLVRILSILFILSGISIFLRDFFIFLNCSKNHRVHRGHRGAQNHQAP